MNHNPKYSSNSSPSDGVSSSKDSHKNENSSVGDESKAFICKHCGKQFNSKMERSTHQARFCVRGKENDSDDDDSFEPPTEKLYEVGTRMKKLYHRTWCLGTIVSYNETTYLYKIEYDDGDEEELEHYEIEKVTEDDVDTCMPQPKKPYKVGSLTKKFFKEYSAWFEARVISYNSKTYLYKVRYGDGDEEAREHHEINTDVFHVRPLFKIGLQFERFFLKKQSNEELGWIAGRVVSRFLFVPSGRPNGTTKRWLYGIEYSNGDR